MRIDYKEFEKFLDEITGFGGFTQLLFVDPETGEERPVLKKNSLTKLGRLLMLQSSANRLLLQPTGYARGTLYRSGGPVQANPSSSVQSRQTLSNSLTFYLLNTAEVLTEDNVVLPVYNQGGINAGVITGFGGLRRSPLSAKEGVIEPVFDDYMINDNAAVSRWKFEQTQANGQITHVAIGLNVMEDPYVKMRIVKGILDTEITQHGGVTQLSSCFIGPGVPGVTSATEVLLCRGVENGNTADCVYDLVTGKLSLLDTVDPRYGMPLGQAGYPQYVVNGKLYYYYGSYLNYLKPETKTREMVGYCDSGSFFPVGDKIYYHSSTNTQFYVWDTLTMASDASVNFTFPTGKESLFNTSGVYASNMFRGSTIRKRNDGKYIVSAQENGSYGPKKELIIEDILNMTTSAMYHTAEDEAKLAEFLVDTEYIQILGPNYTADSWVNVVGVTEQNPYRSEYGVYLSKPKWCGNMISSLKLDAIETKSETEILHGSYGYVIQSV